MAEDTDVVVIGSGIAGALCAWRLAGRGLRVTMLEAGPRIERSEIVRQFQLTHRFDHSAGYPRREWAPYPDWIGDDTYITQLGPDRPEFLYLRVVGGTTWHWTGAADRLLRSDFQMRSKYGVGVDWPITYDDLEPDYVRAEHEIGVAGDPSAEKPSVPFPLPEIPASHADLIIADRLRGLGLNVVPRAAARNTVAFADRPRCEGFGTCVPICPIGAQYAAVDHVLKSEALGARLIADAQAIRLQADPNGTIKRVTFRRPDGTEKSIGGRAFVVAANGVESPRLLLASVSEAFPSGLANTSGLVGRYFMTHPGLTATVDAGFPIFSNRGPVFTSYVPSLRDGPSRSEAGAFLLAIFNQWDLHRLVDGQLRNGHFPPALDGEIRSHAQRVCAFEGFVEQLPDRDNRVAIDWNDRDTAGQPRMQLRFSLGEYARRGLQTLRQTLDQIAGQLNATRVVADEFSSAHHLIGTLRMGRDRKSSVVDSQCRTHDHRNLFVAGSAVFPTAGVASPTLTIAALSLRTADAIFQQLRE